MNFKKFKWADGMYVPKNAKVINLKHETGTILIGKKYLETKKGLFHIKIGKKVSPRLVIHSGNYWAGNQKKEFARR